MRCKLFALVTATALLCPPPVSAQAPTDAAVAKGIKEVEDGELDAAIFTLDAAAKRLGGDPARARDLAQAYLYLGVAYLGKGQETAARTKFKQAVQQLRELRLSADQFPPKVIDLFESARAEVAASAAPLPSPAPSAVASAAPAKKGGSKTPLILVGIGAVAGGVALAAKSGKSGGADFARYYGTYANLMFATQAGGCAPFTATLALSGNTDGSNFRINKTFPPLSTNPPVDFTGTIQSNGNFTGSGGGYSITGQTTGSRISGSETRQSGGPVCTWTFDGPR